MASGGSDVPRIAEIAEVVAHVALNVFTYYFNLTSGTELDFPAVPLRSTSPRRTISR